MNDIRSYMIAKQSYESQNGIFKISDPKTFQLLGINIHSGWWSRNYEYMFAATHIKPGIIADMGAGSQYRPLKDILEKMGNKVYAVDRNKEILNTPKYANVIHVVSDFLSLSTDELPEQLDTIVCVSVLEDLVEDIPEVLKIFRTFLKPTGRIVLTFDTIYNKEKSCDYYPGLTVRKFQEAVEYAGLTMREPFIDSRDKVIYHTDFNLCVAHVVLFPKEKI